MKVALSLPGTSMFPFAPEEPLALGGVSKGYFGESSKFKKKMAQGFA